MKELLEYSEKDDEMFNELEQAINILSAAYSKVDERFLGIAALWRGHRKQLLEEQTEEEFDKNDRFYSKLWDLRDHLRGISNSANSCLDEINIIRKNQEK